MSKRTNTPRKASRSRKTSKRLATKRAFLAHKKASKKGKK